MIVWAAIFGYVVFGDVPSIEIVIGALIIAAAGIYIFLRERKLARDDEPTSMPPA
jgi:drug/metabolite transporter (DMT)-like permease